MKKKIFVAGIHQESNSFSPLMSTKEDFTVYLKGDKLIRQMAGIKEFQEAGYEVIPGIYADACPGGILKLEEYRKIVEEILEQLPADGSVNGVFLPLHGALEVEFVGSGDALLVSLIRERVGGTVPIAAALDLHANNTYTLSKLCNIIYGYRTAPHIDIDETRIRAARMLIRALEEEVMPWTELIRIPMMMPGENFMTESGMGAQIMKMLPDLETIENVWCASYFAGMPWVDCPQGGGAIVISGSGDKTRGIKEARKFGSYIWNNREKFKFQGVSMEPEEALTQLEQGEEYPAFLSDSADNVTAGAAGDNAYLLRIILEKSKKKILIAGFIDAPAVELCKDKKAGDTFTVTLGGSIDKEKSVRVRLDKARLVEVFYEEEKAAAAILKKDNITLLILAERGPIISEEVLNTYRLSAFDFEIVVVKQGYLTPDFYRIARRFIMALTPGNCAQDLNLLEYKKIRRPLEPLERVTDSKRITEIYAG